MGNNINESEDSIMYTVNTATTKADINYMVNRVNEMMRTGVKVGDLTKQTQYIVDFIADTKDELRTKYGIENPNSPKQVAAYLEELADKFAMGTRNDIVNICYDTYKRKWSTDKDALGQLADLGYEFAKTILAYRSAKKYLDLYNGMARFVGTDDKIHPSVSLTKTNRVTYTEPNLVGIKKDALWNIIVPEDGRVLYSVDFKNQEPEILFNLLQDRELLGALQSEDGLYNYMMKQVFKPTTTLSIVFMPNGETRKMKRAELVNSTILSPESFEPKKAGCNSLFCKGEKVVAIETLCYAFNGVGKFNPPETVAVEVESGEVYDVPVRWGDVTVKNGIGTSNGELDGIEFRVDKNDRAQFKRSWLAYTYGASVRSVANIYCHSIDGAKVSKYFSSIKSFKEYRKLVEKSIKNGCRSISTVFGNRVVINEDTDDQQLRTMLNCPMQSTGADILAISIKHFDDEMSSRGLSDKMSIYFTRHDEVIISVDKEFADSNGDNIETALKELFEMQIVHNGYTWTPLRVEVGKLEYTEAHFDFLDIERVED